MDIGANLYNIILESIIPITSVLSNASEIGTGGKNLSCCVPNVVVIYTLGALSLQQDFSF